MKNIFKVIIMTLSIISMSTLAAEGDGVFVHEKQKLSDGKMYNVYKTNIDGGQLLFIADTGDNDENANIISVRYLKNGKFYRAISLSICVPETDQCWNDILFNTYLEELVDNFKSSAQEFPYGKLSWTVDYIKEGELESTQSPTSQPDLGALEKFSGKEADSIGYTDPDDASYQGHYIKWSFGPKVVD